VCCVCVLCVCAVCVCVCVCCVCAVLCVCCAVCMLWVCTLWVCMCSRLQPCVSDLQPYNCDQVELWCQLAGWGLVRVGMVPVPYDAHFRCTFPEISEAELHSVPQHGQSLP
jgi:hypothetical protein